LGTELSKMIMFSNESLYQKPTNFIFYYIKEIAVIIILALLLKKIGVTDSVIGFLLIFVFLFIINEIYSKDSVGTVAILILNYLVIELVIYLTTKN